MMTTSSSSFAVPAGWTQLEGAFLRPYTALLSFMLIASAGLVAAGLLADDQGSMLPAVSLALQASPDPDSDQAFARKAAEGGAGEVALAELAEQKAVNDMVKKTAARIHADHVKANQSLKLIASQKGWDLPSTPGSEAEATRAKLDKLSGAAFDRAYIDAMVSDHQTDITAFEQEAAQGKDAAVKRFATETLPTLKQHLSMALKAQQALTAAGS
jgi:putative membrane protein